MALTAIYSSILHFTSAATSCSLRLLFYFLRFTYLYPLNKYSVCHKYIVCYTRALYSITPLLLRLCHHGNGGGIKQDDSTQLLTGFFFTARIFHFTWLSPTTTDPHHHTHTNSEAVTGSPGGAGVLQTKRRASILLVFLVLNVIAAHFSAALISTHPPTPTRPAQLSRLVESV
jgi:hypothetical protein